MDLENKEPSPRQVTPVYVEHPQYIYEHRLRFRQDLLKRLLDANAPQFLLNKQNEMIDRAQREVNGERFPEPIDPYAMMSDAERKEVDDVVAQLQQENTDSQVTTILFNSTKEVQGAYGPVLFEISCRVSPKLPRKQVVEIQMTTDACPAQWNGKLDTGDNLYIRYRFGRLTVRINDETFLEAVQKVNQMDGSMASSQMRELTDVLLEFL